MSGHLVITLLVQTVPFDEDNYRGQGTISKMDAIG